MREDDEEFRHYVPILRRIIILVAVLTAVPVVLWTITAFVRSYVGPPKVPTFHQLAATASINAPTTSDSTKSSSGRPASEQAKVPDPPPAVMEASATLADAGDSSAASKGPSLADHPPQTAANAPAPSAMKMANMPTTAPTPPKWPEVSPAPASVPAASAGAGPNAPPWPAAQPPAAATEPPAEDLPAATPLTGPIPLPRHRPRELGAVHIADMAPSSVPIPRPRPDAAGPGAASETSESPIGFIQNLFH